MKKRNLFLSLICSIVLSITLVLAAVTGVIMPNFNDGKSPIVPPTTDVGSVADYSAYEEHNETADGSIENPYYLYNTESFIELLQAHGTEECYFEVVEDIDFTDYEYVTLFIGDEAFNGKINGNGHSLDNISINVTLENLNQFETSQIISDTDIEGNTNQRNVHNAKIALFGTIKNAEITNLSIDNMNINVENEVYGGITIGAYATSENPINEMVVASIASYAYDSKIEVNVNANISANAYAAVDNEGRLQGYNTIAGMVGVANATTIANSEANITMNTDKGLSYNFNNRTGKKENVDNNFVAGVVGYLVNESEISGMTVIFNLTAHYNQESYIGGIVGYTRASKIENDQVTFTVTENRSRATERFDIRNVDEIVSWVGGIACTVGENTTISNSIAYSANIAFDCIFGGVYANAYTKLVDGVNVGVDGIVVEDVIVNANVDVLRAFGVAYFAGNNTVLNFNKTVVDYSNNQTNYYFIKLAGSVRLNYLIEKVNDESRVYHAVNMVDSLGIGNRDFDSIADGKGFGISLELKYSLVGILSNTYYLYTI